MIKHLFIVAALALLNLWTLARLTRGVEISQRQRDATEPQRTESRPLGSP